MKVGLRKRRKLEVDLSSSSKLYFEEGKGNSANGRMMSISIVRWSKRQRDTERDTERDQHAMSFVQI